MVTSLDFIGQFWGLRSFLGLVKFTFGGERVKKNYEKANIIFLVSQMLKNGMNFGMALGVLNKGVALQFSVNQKLLNKFLGVFCMSFWKTTTKPWFNCHTGLGCVHWNG